MCHGLGQKMVFDPSLIVPDETKTLEDGAVQPYRRMGGKKMVSYYKGLIKGVAQHCGAPLDRPWKELSEEARRTLMHGSGTDEVEFWFMSGGAPKKTRKPFEGVLPNLERLYADSESEFTRNRLKAYMTLQPCDACRGRRLRPEMLAVTLGSESLPGSRVPGRSIADFCGLSIAEAHTFLAGLSMSDLQRRIAGEVILEIRKRLGFMVEVGLGYLTLDRESGSLSGEKPSASAWRPRSGPDWWGFSISWTSRASDFTSATTTGFWRRSAACGMPAIRSSWWSMTKTPSGPPIMCWT